MKKPDKCEDCGHTELSQHHNEVDEPLWFCDKCGTSHEFNDEEGFWMLDPHPYAYQ